MLIVESLTTKKRMPAYARDKVVSLGDIAIYTDGEEVPLSKVMTTIYEKMVKRSIRILIRRMMKFGIFS